MKPQILIKASIIALAFGVVPLSAAPIRAAGLPVTGENRQSEDNRAKALKKYLEAQRLEKDGNFPAAVSAYKEAVALDPTSAELRIAFGALYLKSRNVIDAEAQAREAMKLAPDNLDGRKLLSRIYLYQTFVGTAIDKDKARAAIKELEAVAASDPAAKIEIGDQDSPVLAAIGELYIALDEEDKGLDALKRVSQSDSSSDRAHFRLAQLLFQKNKIREAAAAARKAYDIDQKSAPYAQLLAKCLLRMGRSQEALEIYKKALGVKPGEGKEDQTGPDSIIASPLLFDYAEALVSAGRYDEALKKLEPVLKLARKDSPLYLNAIRIQTDALRRAGKRDEAVRTIEEALKGQDTSESLPLLYSLAETYEEMHEFNKAVASYEEALQNLLNPDGTISGREQEKQSVGLLLRRIVLAYKLDGKRDKMMETFERARKILGAGDPTPDQLLIDSLLAEGKNKEAFEAATQASARHPNDRPLGLYRAQAQARLGEMAAAEATVRALLKDGPEDVDVYVFLASIQLEANQLRQAEESVRKAISYDTNDIGPLVTLSIIQERQKKYKDSEATLRKALEIDPDNATLLNNLGYFLADRGERMQEAEDLINRAVNIEPTNGSFLDSLGWVFFKQGKFGEAQKYLEKAVVYQPRSATIHDHLGDLYKKQGQIERARGKWEDALRLATEPDEIKKIKEKLGKK
ncbi:MAG TPA: tetratricopeptide repeat protein [Blastocatellia bacterium]|nr:tetratricopeptide repeat protein [Blastocatellia bacterium]